MNYKYILLSIAFALGGCDGSSGDSNNGGGDNGGGDNGGGSNHELMANTLDAAGFAFIENSNHTATNSRQSQMLDTISNDEESFFSGSKQAYYGCEQLVKLVEIGIQHSIEVPEDEEEAENISQGYQTVKIFQEMDEHSCTIEEAITTKENLIIRGYFNDLADAQGEKLDNCRLIALPLEARLAAPQCLFVSDSHDEDGNWYAQRAEPSNLKASLDGNYFVFSHDFPRYSEKDLYQSTVSQWDGIGDIEPVINYQIDSGSTRYRHPFKHWTLNGQYHGLFLSYNYSLFGKHLGQDTHLFQDLEYFNNGLWDDWLTLGHYLVTPYYKTSYDNEYLGNLIINLFDGSHSFQRYGPENGLCDEFFGCDGLSRVYATQQVQGGVYAFANIGHDFTSNPGRGFYFFDNETLEAELIHLPDSAYPQFSHLGESHIAFLPEEKDFSLTKMTYFDMNTGLYYGDNLLDNKVFENSMNIAFRQNTNGLKFIVNYIDGTAKEVFYNQMTGEFSDDPIDHQEIGSTIPLMPSY
ncbi:hypothetical protein [Vibrio agarivorans]|uniref:hypothetical protein n=1 Tax=Vibrio agarivorans TaxID=153622 RepID=UPI00222F88B1|nr:hypothetical protein [Vibrio agarivorans]